MAWWPLTYFNKLFFLVLGHRFFKNKTNYQTLFFRAVLGSQQNWEGTEIFHMLSCPHAWVPFPIIYFPHQSGTLVTTDELTLTHYNHSKFIFTSGFTLDAVHSVNLDNCIMIWHVSITVILSTEQFHYPKNSLYYACSSLIFSLATPGNHWSLSS